MLVRFFLTLEVAPLAGAWIEIYSWNTTLIGYTVAPLAGAWIEIFLCCSKYRYYPVAPLAGAWIEISTPL